MTLQAKLCRPLNALVISALLLAPGLARAQLDDPGLAPPPAPPPRPAPVPVPVAPAPAPLPKPVVMPPAAPAPAPVAAPVPAAAVTPVPAIVNGAETTTKEEVAEESKTTQNKPDDAGWEKLLAASSLNGGIGLLHMMTAETGAPGSFRLALHTQFFRQDEFLVDKNGTVPGDSNQRFMGDFNLSIAGPDYTFIRNFEFYASVYNSSNENKRTDPARTDPPVILSLADIGLGIKGAYEIANGFSLGANVGIRIMQSIAAASAQGDATTVDLNLLAKLDVRKFAPKVPLQFHLSLGYYVDNSLKLLPANQCSTSTTNDACIRSRLVETFAYGLNLPRLRTAIGVEIPILVHYGDGNIFGLSIFGEAHIDAATGDGDTVIAPRLAQYSNEVLAGCAVDPNPTACQQRVANLRSNTTRTWSSYGTIGVRLRPIERLMIDLGVDFNMKSPGYAFGPAIPRWNVLIGLGYAFDFTGSTTREIKRTVTRTIEITRKPPPEGKIAGTVVDVKSGKPIAGAVIRYGGAMTPQATDEKGQFVSYGLPPGQVQMQVVHPDYEPVSGTPNAVANETKNIKIGLKPLPPKEGKIRVKVVDDKGALLAGASGRFTCPNNITKDATFDGEQLVASLPPGDCAVSVDAPNFLSKERQVAVVSSTDQQVEVQLNKRPKESHVTVTKDAIVIKGTIHFETGKAVIMPDGQQIVNEVVDALAKNPQIKRVSIEGHTDNAGEAAKNLQLSKDRAKAVLDYMVKNGIAASRLTSEGFGQDKPLVPNTGASNKAKNRRVEFRIMDQAAMPTP